MNFYSFVLDFEKQYNIFISLQWKLICFECSCIFMMKVSTARIQRTRNIYVKGICTIAIVTSKRFLFQWQEWVRVSEWVFFMEWNENGQQMFEVPLILQWLKLCTNSGLYLNQTGWMLSQRRVMFTVHFFSFVLECGHHLFFTSSLWQVSCFCRCLPLSSGAPSKSIKTCIIWRGRIERRRTIFS